MSPCAGHNVANDLQATVKEMVGTGNDNHRQVHWLGPSEDIGQRNGFIDRAVDDDGVTGHRPRRVGSCALDVARRRADKNETLCRMVGGGQSVRHPGLDIGTKGKPASTTGRSP